MLILANRNGAPVMKAVKYILIVLAILSVVGVAGFAYLGVSSQSGSAPGLVDGQLSPCPDSPNCVSSEAGTVADKLTETLPASAWDALPQVVDDMGGEVTLANADYVSAEFTSLLFGFVDDVEFRKGDDGVHVRSASRVGYSDRGVNAARIAEIRERVSN